MRYLNDHHEASRCDSCIRPVNLERFKFLVSYYIFQLPYMLRKVLTIKEHCGISLFAVCTIITACPSKTRFRQMLFLSYRLHHKPQSILLSDNFMSTIRTVTQGFTLHTC